MSRVMEYVHSLRKKFTYHILHSQIARVYAAIYMQGYMEIFIDYRNNLVNCEKSRILGIEFVTRYLDQQINFYEMFTA